MIRHIVCYKTKDPSQELFEKTKDVLMSMKGVVPEIVDITVGIDVLKSERSFDLVLSVDFESFESMQTYQQNEYHKTVVKPYMHSIMERSVSVDFEL